MTHTALRLAAALVMAGGTVTALTMGPAEAAPAACNASDAARPKAPWLGFLQPGSRHRP